MGASLKRDELDRLAQFYELRSPAVETLLDVANARPSAAETRHFFTRVARYGGVLSIAAGIVFFVAANWSRVAVFGRFALLEFLLLAFVGVALYKPPPRFVGRAALFLAFIVTGALLALVGQTYQTGADVYELFLAWAIVGLPFAVLARWGVASAAWLLVLNIALVIFGGWQPRGGLLWSLFDGNRFSVGQAVLASAALNIVLWLASEKFTWAAAPDWVRRIAITCGMGFVTWAGILGVTGGEPVALGTPVEPPTAALAFLALALVAGVTVYLRRDVYPLALALASFIFVTLCWMPQHMGGSDQGLFFGMALWLIVSSAVTGKVLMLLMRRWRAEAA